MPSESVVVSLLSLFPQGRRFVRTFRDIQADLTALRIAVGGLQVAVEGKPPLPAGTPSSPDAEADRVTARELQLLAAMHQPLLAGDLTVTDDRIEARGIAVAPDGLFDSLTFYLNGQPFNEVTYPLHDPGITKLFSEVSGAAAFFASISRTRVDPEARFFRIDVSSTGAPVPARWQQANWFGNPAHERFPMPPANAMRRVIGDDHAARFSLGGATIFNKAERYLSEMGKTWSDFRNVLDWGCGAGRLARYLLGCGPVVTGADIDRDNVAWCAGNLTGGRFVSLDLAPPTPFATGEFDLVFGCSVVTHLTEEMLCAWLAELRRITAPGALLFLSVAGPVQYVYLGIAPALYRLQEARGFLDFARDSALDSHIADENYYRSTWMSRDYIKRLWRRYFDVVAIVDGAAALQDFVVLRRRER